MLSKNKATATGATVRWRETQETSPMSDSIMTKVCCRCNVEKPVSAFYIRTGYAHSPTNASYYLSECKDCLKDRSKITGGVHPLMPRAETEILALRALTTYGIYAVPGKAVHAADVDVVALGNVWIEVKFSRSKNNRGKIGFTFTSTPKQMERGYLAHLVMLICDYGHDRMTYHLLPANHPVFYINNRIKSGFTFTPGRYKALKHGHNRVVMTQGIMNEYENRWDLAWDKHLELCLGLSKCGRDEFMAALLKGFECFIPGK